MDSSSFARVLICGWLATSLMGVWTFGGGTWEPSLSHRIDSLFEAWDSTHTPGVAAGVIHKGTVVHRKGYGMANLEHGIPVTPDTVFDVASVSKQFAGMAVAILAEKGLLDLDASYRIYLPEMPELGEDVTVRHLVHHTGGFRDWPSTLALAGWRMDDVITFEQILEMAKHQHHLNFKPGEEYTYSNTGYNLLAEIVGRLSGTSFPEWTREHLFEPLGMESSRFPRNHGEIIPRSAESYHRQADGYAKVMNGLTAFGSSSLHTSLNDLIRWTENLEECRVGGQRAIARMMERGVLNNGKTIDYAYGQAVTEWRGFQRVSHTGSWAGFRTILTRFPEERLAIILLSNDSGFQTSEMADQIAAWVLGIEAQSKETDKGVSQAQSASDSKSNHETPWEPEDWGEYEGVYESPELQVRYTVTATPEDSCLTASIGLRERITLRADTDEADRFKGNSWYFGKVRFERDQEGQIKGFYVTGNTRMRNVWFKKLGP